jgi:ketosteroid isomerase-like protein
VREALQAYDRSDFESLRSFLAENVVWHVGGRHPLSGDYFGREGVIEYCKRAQELAGRTLQGEVLEVLADDRHAGVFNRITAQRDGERLDVTLAQAITFDDEGRWTEYWALADDQDAVDAFWGAQ